MNKIFKKQSLVISGILIMLTGFASTSAIADDMAPAVQQYMQGNHAAALPRLSQLAREGNPEAQFALGLAYEHGRSVNMNPIMAMYWYDLSARTYTEMGASIASRYSREAVTRLQYKHKGARVASK